MKIIRYQSASGEIGFAQLLANGSATKLRGDLFAGFTDTGEPAEVVKRLAPLEPRVVLCIGLNYRQHAAETERAAPEISRSLLQKSRVGPKSRATRSRSRAGSAANASTTNANSPW